MDAFWCRRSASASKKSSAARCACTRARLRVYQGQKRLTGAEKVSEIATKTGSYECRGSKTVGGFEKDMMENFGLKVQVASADDWVLALDEMTLAKLPEIPKNAKKADMDALKAKYAK